MSPSVSITTSSPDDTQQLGSVFGSLLESGRIVALHGELAAGKTCFVHGVAEALQARDAVSSPTFTLVNEYHGTMPIYHLDLYRLNHVAELYDLGYEDLLARGDGICLIEWAERAEKALPEDVIHVKFEHAGEDKRTISFSTEGGLPAEWQDSLNAATD